VQLRGRALRRRCGVCDRRRVRGGRIGVRALRELRTLTRGDQGDERRRVAARGASFVPRKQERVAIDTRKKGDRPRVAAVDGGLALEQICSAAREKADQILPTVCGLASAIVRQSLLGQLALLRQQAQRQADHEHTWGAKRGEKQEGRARRPREHAAYCTDSPPGDLS
jgi:hypothetical protein